MLLLFIAGVVGVVVARVVGIAIVAVTIAGGGNVGYNGYNDDDPDQNVGHNGRYVETKGGLAAPGGSQRVPALLCIPSLQQQSLLSSQLVPQGGGSWWYSFQKLMMRRWG